VSYVKGETAIITATVTDGTNPVSDAAVDLRIETPNGRIYSGNGTTDANGQAAFSFRVNPNKDGSGTYNVTATASKTGYTSGTGTTSFTVQ
ncbi:MAG: peptidase S8, partial [Gammaproteobacteria bacterium]|nr:peptidase S8 [Gammaproteobacteria bacterium]